MYLELNTAHGEPVASRVTQCLLPHLSSQSDQFQDKRVFDQAPVE